MLTLTESGRAHICPSAAIQNNRELPKHLPTKCLSLQGTGLVSRGSICRASADFQQVLLALGFGCRAWFPACKEERQKRSWAAGQRGSLGSAEGLSDGRTTAVSCATVYGLRMQATKELQSPPGWTGCKDSNEHETRAADSQAERTLS